MHVYGRFNVLVRSQIRKLTLATGRNFRDKLLVTFYLATGSLLMMAAPGIKTVNAPVVII